MFVEKIYEHSQKQEKVWDREGNISVQKLV